MFGHDAKLKDVNRPVSQIRVKKLPINCTPTDLFLSIRKRYEYAYLLESMVGPKKLAQFSFIGFNPRLIVSIKNNKVLLEDMRSKDEVSFETTQPLRTVKDLLGKEEVDAPFRFVGGAVGYFSYDAVRNWEKLPEKACDDQNFPDIHMGIYDENVIFDHNKGEVYYISRSRDHLLELIDLSKEPRKLNGLTCKTPNVNISKEDFEELVERAKGYIASGDIFQVVLSKRYDFEVNGDFTKFYLLLSQINPSPYMYFLEMGERRIIGSSPEMLVRVEGNLVETYPIAGTRPIVEDPAKNRVLATELLEDPKERAEHVMLVDLARNDVGRVSEYGSVGVPEFMQVHPYSHVQHIVSRVEGRLREDCDCYDAIRAVFPAGTVSGAPKVRAMEIIEESEPTRRGPYAGAVGYFSYNGNADFAITIRTLVASRQKCSIQVGGGIVADSIPEKEWFETEHKAEALMKALKLAEES